MNLLAKILMFFGISFLFLISFLFASTFLNGNVYIKQFGVELYIGLISIVFCIVVLIKKGCYEINLNFVDLAIILLLALYTCLLLFYSHKFSDHGLPFYYGLFYFTTSFVIRSLNNFNLNKLIDSFKFVVPLIIIVHILLVIFQQNGIVPSFHGYFNNGSTFGNPDMLGSYIAVLLPFCFMQKEGWKKIGYFAFLTGIILLFFIQARSALLAGLLCAILWLKLNQRFSKKQVIILTSLSIGLLALLILWHPESVYGRFFVWFVSLKMIIEKPMGWGIFAFDKHYPEFQASYLATIQNLPDFFNPEVLHSPFNEFLNIGVSFGVAGLLLFITLVIFVFHNSIKSKSLLTYPLFIFFVISLFYFPFSIAPLVVLVISMVAVVSNKNSRIIFQKQLSQSTSRIFFFALILISLFLLANSISNYRNYKNWQKAVSCSKDPEGLVESERLFSTLYPSMKENGRFLVTYSNLKYRQAFPIKALELLEKAETCFCDVTLSLKLAELYEELNFYEQAEKKFDLAINIAPNNFMASYEKILFLQNIGKLEDAYFEAIRLIKKPVKVSNFADPYIIKSRLRKYIEKYESGVISDSITIFKK